MIGTMPKPFIFVLMPFADTFEDGNYSAPKIVAKQGLFGLGSVS